jgi:hypothetical protein
VAGLRSAGKVRSWAAVGAVFVGGFLAAVVWATRAPAESSHGVGTAGSYECSAGLHPWILNNWNILAVALNGGTPPQFSTDGKPYCLIALSTEHFNNGEGAPPGSIGVSGVGSWPAVGSLNGLNAPTIWTATVPGQVIINGTYTCVDSDPSTWSQNAVSGGEGFCRVTAAPATLVSSGPSTATKTTTAPAPTTTNSATTPAPVTTTTSSVPASCVAGANAGQQHATRSTQGLEVLGSQAVEPPPTLWSLDPNGGIGVSAGKVFRGTGPLDPSDPTSRPAFYLWYVPGKDEENCKDFEWYQFVLETATLNSLKDVTDILAKSEGRVDSGPLDHDTVPGPIDSVNDAPITFGKWSADDYPTADKAQKLQNDIHPKAKVFVPPKEAMCDPPSDNLPKGRVPSGGRYILTPIPGTPGVMGLKDSPNYGEKGPKGELGAWGKLFRRLLQHGQLGETKQLYVEPKPAAISGYTLDITYQFRDCLYSIDKTKTPPTAVALGYSEETYTEKLVFSKDWTTSGQTNDYWWAIPGSVTDTTSVKFGAWTQLPKGPRTATGPGK